MSKSKSLSHCSIMRLYPYLRLNEMGNVSVITFSKGKLWKEHFMLRTHQANVMRAEEAWPVFLSNSWKGPQVQLPRKRLDIPTQPPQHKSEVNKWALEQVRSLVAKAVTGHLQTTCQLYFLLSPDPPISTFSFQTKVSGSSGGTHQTIFW